MRITFFRPHSAYGSRGGARGYFIYDRNDLWQIVGLLLALATSAINGDPFRFSDCQCDLLWSSPTDDLVNVL